MLSPSGTKCIMQRETKFHTHAKRQFEHRSRHGCMSAFFCLVLSCVDRSLAISRFRGQGVLSICSKGLIISEVNSESEQFSGRTS
jgi:hypothetical protein